MKKGTFEEQTGVPLMETPAGKVISYFELLYKLEPEDCCIWTETVYEINPEETITICYPWTGINTLTKTYY